MTTDTAPVAPTRIAYSPGEVAEMLGITTQTVYRMIAREDIPARKVGTRNYRILAKDVDTYLASRITTGS